MKNKKPDNVISISAARNRQSEKPDFNILHTHMARYAGFQSSIDIDGGILFTKERFNFLQRWAIRITLGWKVTNLDR